MQTNYGHLTFCTNIFSGESWEDHFEQLKQNVPAIKKELTPDRPLALGLRLSNKASLGLQKEANLTEFKNWLQENDAYVISINGFPYGNFHKTRVKEEVHSPDWTTASRLQYTQWLFQLLASLLPSGAEGGVSTSPLSYYRWFDQDEITAAKKKAAKSIAGMVLMLADIHQTTGKLLHLDVEPEADGILETSGGFIDWYQNYLLPIGIPILREEKRFSKKEAEESIRNHVRLCFDVCHFAVGFEEVEDILKKLEQAGIKIGRWQLSAALKARFSEKDDREEVLETLAQFDEPVYLHQVVAQLPDRQLLRFPDLPEALRDKKALQAKEWRSHFHVPLFVENYGLLSSTQEDVKKAISCQKKKPVCKILEVETYTWDVLPEQLKLPLPKSVIRELQWVLETFASEE